MITPRDAIIVPSTRRNVMLTAKVHARSAKSAATRAQINVQPIKAHVRNARSGTSCGRFNVQLEYMAEGVDSGVENPGVMKPMSPQVVEAQSTRQGLCFACWHCSGDAYYRGTATANPRLYRTYSTALVNFCSYFCERRVPQGTQGWAMARNCWFLLAV
ncbi:hypothetical protein VFPPC_11211 [Pochonia chlamydosporia 170]|uniref:Uncharacterized protein n=1 Tax=Pochonia chlamydosporia 170 TaxID=1380566 RepID=A0A179FCE5_METCM|nr:hypothetical protein VFPPC_11211 [Pochonia chlamydosporia 170]OAQ62733.2 hypothetical protein VFPPC_11211 [Pochonia chlamydosporia 170]